MLTAPAILYEAICTVCHSRQVSHCCLPMRIKDALAPVMKMIDNRGLDVQVEQFK